MMDTMIILQITKSCGLIENKVTARDSINIDPLFKDHYLLDFSNSIWNSWHINLTKDSQNISLEECSAQATTIS